MLKKNISNDKINANINTGDKNMEVLKIFISFLPVIIVGLFYLLVNKKKVSLNNVLNIFLVSFFLIFLSTIIRSVTTFVGAVSFLGMKQIIPNLSLEYGFGLFIKAFVSAGLCEEVAKWVGIKILKPKNKREIVVFSIFVAAFLSSLENNSFIQKFDLATGIYRVLLEMHILFQIIMSFFMVKAFDKKKEGKKSLSFLLQLIAILIPSIIHGIYDAIFWNIQTQEINILIPFVVGILIYGITFLILYKYRDNDEPKEDETKKASLFKIIISIVIFIFWAYTFSGFTNSKVNIEPNNEISYIENRIE